MLLVTCNLPDPSLALRRHTKSNFCIYQYLEFAFRADKILTLALYGLKIQQSWGLRNCYFFDLEILKKSRDLAIHEVVTVFVKLHIHRVGTLKIEPCIKLTLQPQLRPEFQYWRRRGSYGLYTIVRMLSSVHFYSSKPLDNLPTKRGPATKWIYIAEGHLDGLALFCDAITKERDIFQLHI